MSDTDGPLLGRGSEPVDVRWEEDDSAVRRPHRAWASCGQALAGSLVVALTSFLILYLWYSTFVAVDIHPAGALGTPVVAVPERDIRLVLHPEEHVSRAPGIRRYSWNVTKSTIAPDGVEKEVFLINGAFPGPTIEARSGDTLEIEIFNCLEEGVSFHWHGLHMRGANHMDGPVGITQCAIPPGGNFIYRIPSGEQAGTFWYHAHSEVQRGDGLYGGLIIHNPEVAEKASYDTELLFLVGDWYHWPSQKVLDYFMSITSSGNEPCPDSLLVNGLGYFECSMAVPASPVNCSEVQKPWLSLDKQQRYRVRLVNVGSLTGFSFTVPDSRMDVIQVDGGLPVISQPANSIGVLYPAERVDFVMSWAESAVDTDSEIVVELDSEYFFRPNFALSPNQTFLLTSESVSSEKRSGTPSDMIEPVRFDLRGAEGPTLAFPLPDPGKTFLLYAVVLALNHLGGIPMGFVNHTTWRPQKVPLVSLERGAWDEHQLVPWTGPEPVWVELTINNIDTTGHPFHLHGFDFYVIASYEGKGGYDYYNPFESKPPRGGPFNLKNPIRRDTVYVPAYGYVVIRFLADNEGIWAMHCHVLWHQASGMTMAFQVLGDEHKGLSESAVGQEANISCAARPGGNFL